MPLITSSFYFDTSGYLCLEMLSFEFLGHSDLLDSLLQYSYAELLSSVSPSF